MRDIEKTEVIADSFEKNLETTSDGVNMFLEMHEKQSPGFAARDPEEYGGSWADESTGLRLDVHQSVAWDGSGSLNTVKILGNETFPEKIVKISSNSALLEDGYYAYEKRAQVYETAESGEKRWRDATSVDLNEVTTICAIASADFASKIRKEVLGRALSARASDSFSAIKTLKELSVSELAYFGALFAKDSQE